MKSQGNGSGFVLCRCPCSLQLVSVSVKLSQWISFWVKSRRRELKSCYPMLHNATNLLKWRRALLLRWWQSRTNWLHAGPAEQLNGLRWRRIRAGEGALGTLAEILAVLWYLSKIMLHRLKGLVKHLGRENTIYFIHGEIKKQWLIYLFFPPLFFHIEEKTLEESFSLQHWIHVQCLQNH